MIGKKHSSLDEGISDSGKVRRLIKLFDKNKVQPSPVATERDKFSETVNLFKSAPIDRRCPVKHSRHYSESDSLLKNALLNSAYEVSKSPSSPVFRSPTVKLFSNDVNQWEMDL